MKIPAHLSLLWLQIIKPHSYLSLDLPLERTPKHDFLGLEDTCTMVYVSCQSNTMQRICSQNPTLQFSILFAFLIFTAEQELRLSTYHIVAQKSNIIFCQLSAKLVNHLSKISSQCTFVRIILVSIICTQKQKAGLVLWL